MSTEHKNARTRSSTSKSGVGVLIAAGMVALAAGALFLLQQGHTKAIPMQEEVFVQGAAFVDGDLILSSGGYGASYIGRLVDGKVDAKWRLPDSYFAEGLTSLNGKTYVLTWREHTAFVFDDADDHFTVRESLTYPTEGWGLTDDGEHLWLSDGSSNLYMLDPRTFHEESRVIVTESGETVENLNELEYANGFIYANVWRETRILKIDPETSDVVDTFDFEALAQESAKAGDPEAVLNGIAHIEDDDFYLFGKNWKNYYRVTLR